MRCVFQWSKSSINFLKKIMIIKYSDDELITKYINL